MIFGKLRRSDADDLLSDVFDLGAKPFGSDGFCCSHFAVIVLTLADFADLTKPVKFATMHASISLIDSPDFDIA